MLFKFFIINLTNILENINLSVCWEFENEIISLPAILLKMQRRRLSLHEKEAEVSQRINPKLIHQGLKYKKDFAMIKNGGLQKVILS